MDTTIRNNTGKRQTKSACVVKQGDNNTHEQHFI